MTDTRSSRLRRIVPFLCMGSALALAGFVASAHSDPPDHFQPAEPAVPAAMASSAAPIPALALGYQPGSGAGEQRIAKAQEHARKQANAESYADLALVLLQRKRETSDAAYLQYATDALNAAEAIDAELFRVRLVKTMVALDAHRFEGALKMARKMVQLRPDTPVGHLLAGDALLELGRYDEAVDAYQRALDLRPDLRSYNRAAHLRWLHGDFDGARETIELALDSGSPRDPESMAWCYVDLGTMYLKRGDAARALASAQRAEQLQQGYAPALMLRGYALAMKGDRAAAITVLEEAVEKLPHVLDLLLLSELQQSQGDLAEGKRRRAQAERLGNADPRPLAAYYARHNIEIERAVELAEQELTQRRNIAAYDTHALVMLRAGKLDKARASLDKAMKLGTRDADLFLHRALLELASGDRDAARQAFDSALTINPLADPLLAREIKRQLEAR